MNVADFVAARRARWEQLELLLAAAETRGLAGLKVDEARSLAKLYRLTSADFVRAKGSLTARELTDYLNDLVGRAYAVLTPRRRLQWADAREFVLRGFPRVFRQERGAFVAAAALFLGGALFGYVGMAADPDAARYLIPGGHEDVDPAERATDAAESPTASVDEQVAFSSFLFTHNIQVAFLAFALGVTGGVGTVLLLFVNGLFLGSLAFVYQQKDMLSWFWAWILPHGIPEITAICIAGAAGLVMARGLVAPKGLARAVALKVEARQAVRLLFGTLLLFVVAGCIEGTISQIHPPHLSVEFKITFALVVGLAVYAYLLSAPQGADDASRAEAAL